MLLGVVVLPRRAQRVLKLAISVLLVLFAGRTADCQAKTYYCEGNGSAQLDKRAQRSTLKAWMKNPSRFRIEETANGRKILTICDGAHIWLLSPNGKKGVHRLRTPQEITATAGQLRVVGDDVIGFRKQGAKLKGKQSVDGVLCDLYEMKKEGLTHRIWVIPGPDRLTKKRHSFGISDFSMGVSVPMQKHKLNRQMTYNWKTNVATPDSLFKVPAGYKIQETQAAPPPVFAPPAGRRR